MATPHNRRVTEPICSLEKWQQLLLLGLVLITLFVRHPYAIFLPQPSKAEITFLFLEAYKYGSDSLSSPSLGYLNFFARTVALFSSLLPTAWMPSMYLFGSFIAALLPVMLLLLPEIRAPRKDLLVPLLFLSPTNSNSLFTLTATHIYFSYALILYSVLTPPESLRKMLALFVGLVICSLSSPMTIAILPFLAFNAIRYRNRFLVLLLIAASGSSFLQLSLVPQQASALVHSSALLYLRDLLSTFFGMLFFIHPEQALGTLWTASLVSVLGLTLLLSLLYSHFKSHEVLGCFLLITATLSLVNLPALVHYGADVTTLQLFQEGHFDLSILTLTSCLALTRPLRSGLPIFLLFIMTAQFCLIGSRFQATLSPDLDWHDQAACVDSPAIQRCTLSVLPYPTTVFLQK